MVFERLSNKCRYALQALFELASRNPSGPFSAEDIALAQGIPSRFLQLILNELRHYGLVESVRGNEGGYILARNPNSMTVGEIVRLIGAKRRNSGADVWEIRGLSGDYAFNKIWSQADQVLSSLLDTVTLADLVQQDRALRDNHAFDYAI